MNRPIFDDLVTEFLREAEAVRNQKGAEYATDADVLANFKRCELLTGLPVDKVIILLLAKHFDAISTIVRVGNPVHLDSNNSLRGRLIDLVNYSLFLLAAHEGGA
jgi:hypothetical protein